VNVIGIKWVFKNK
jgi:hypothetical protein